MNCQTTREHLNAWCDRQLAPDLAQAVGVHLEACAECRTAEESLRAQDAMLRRVLSPPMGSADRIASKVLQQFELSDIAPAVSPALGFSPMRLVSLLLATAAGFLLAVVIFQPWRYEPEVTQSMPTPNNAVALGPPAAHLVTATGQVDIRPAGSQDWQATPLEKLNLLTCPSGSEVRTGPNVQCELKTPTGGVIRLNDQTQITLAGQDTIQVERGQVWCSTPGKSGFKVVTPVAQASKTPNWGGCELACSSAACVQTAIDPDGCVQVTTSAGDIDLLTPEGRQRLKQGETVSIVDGAIAKTTRADDPLLAARWTQPLLVRKGHDSRELGGYVDELLARVGQSKLSYLYEQDIRSLGEYAALPLIRYVQSPISRDDLQRREVAMRIVADIAPSWTIADMISLLADDDPSTRFLAAKTLHRLTGIDQGRSPDAWRDELEACQPAIVQWRAWWGENQKRYPAPPISGNVGGAKV